MNSTDSAFEATLLSTLAGRDLSFVEGQTSPRSVAQEFWPRAAGHAPLSVEFRTMASEMARRLQA